VYKQGSGTTTTGTEMRASEFRETERLQVAVASFSTLHSLRQWLARACIEL